MVFATRFIFFFLTRLKELFMILIGTIYGDADPRSVSSNVMAKAFGFVQHNFQTNKKELFRVFNFKKRSIFNLSNSL